MRVKSAEKSPVAMTILQKVWESIPEVDKANILKAKSYSFSQNGKKVRMQPFIPNELYVMLVYFNAFHQSESDFFTSRAVEFIERRAIELGLLNTMAKDGRI